MRNIEFENNYQSDKYNSFGVTEKDGGMKDACLAKKTTNQKKRK